MTRFLHTLWLFPWRVIAASSDFIVRSAGILLSVPARITTHGPIAGVSSTLRSLRGVWFLCLWRQDFPARRPHFIGSFGFTLSTGRTITIAAQLLPLDSNPVLLKVQLESSPAGHFLIERADAPCVAATISPDSPRKPINNLLAMAFPWLRLAPDREGITTTFTAVLRWLLV